MEVRKKIEVLENLARQWNEAGFSYAVANGLQGYPQTIGRDIDVVTSPEDLKKTLFRTIDFLKEEKFTVLPYKLGWPYWIVAFRREGNGILSVQVDLFDHLQWGFSWVVDGLGSESLVKFEGPFKIDAWSTIGKRIVLNGLSGNFETFEEKPWYLDSSSDERDSLSRNFERLSGDHSRALQKAIAKGDVTALRSKFKGFRKSVFRRSLTSWQKILPRLFNAWKKQYYFNWAPPRQGPILVLDQVTPEVLAELSKRIAGILPYVVKIRGEADFSSLGIDWSLKTIRKFRRSSALIEIQIFAAGDWHELLRTCRFSRFFLEPDLHLEMDRLSVDEAVERLLEWLERDSPVRLRERILEFSK